MYNLVDPNTKLAAICFNGGKPNLFRVSSRCLVSRSEGSTDDSTTKTQGGWTTFGINVHWSTQSGDCSPSKWCSHTMTWGACSWYLVNTTCSRRLSWMFHCWDLLKIFSIVWFNWMKMFRLYYYVVSLFCCNLV